MAESPLDRLKRLAAEKKQVSTSAQPITIEAKELANERVHTAESTGSITIATGSREAQDRQITISPESNAGSNSSEGAVSGDSAEAASSVESSSSLVTASEPSSIGTSDHPLAMQFAELEAALLAQQPEFKTILRQIHRHLGQEPELVTQMTEQEIQMIVSGLVVFANAEIVAPAIAKTAKAAIKAAKAKPISADDL